MRTFTLTLIILFCNVSLWANDALLSGTPMGSLSVDYNNGSVSTTVNQPANAFDGNLDTYYASYARSYTWVGLDLGDRKSVV